ncbi:probable peptidyl-alpha-hydroxyglycine alpha-amidating lyase pgal-1 [Littorina saxatilis]|uniref:peptidylamidoglycolate lyase n=1 Tax=Littorina saxatilis TaxID=31220 RepID=A0AAN9C3H6_9CAEN
MAALLVVCVTMLAMVSKGLTVPAGARQGRDRLTAEFLTDYLNQQQRLPVQGPVEVPNWPRHDLELGEVAGVDVMPNGDVMIFHRGERSWEADTFDDLTNALPESKRINITRSTLVRLRANSGQVVDSFGANKFYVPHGLTIDKKGNLWLTDVGTDQIFRIPSGQTEPDLVLGEKFVPGNDDTHFCKPTDVAVADNGDFFVADGYCNSRVLKFSSDGALLGKFGMDTRGVGVDSPYSMNVPHSLALIEDLDILCVADRENQRVLCYNAGLGDTKFGQFNRTLVPGGEIGQVYGLAYDPNAAVMYVAALLSQMPVMNRGFSYSPARAFTYDLEGNYLGGWGYISPSEAETGPSIPHDIAVSPNGNDVYIADVLQHAVHKFTEPQNKNYLA